MVSVVAAVACWAAPLVTACAGRVPNSISGDVHLSGSMLQPASAALKVEIVAEAARNPHVAQIVREADAACRRELMVTIRAIRSAAGHDDTAEATADMVEVLASLFEGLLLRTIRNPDLDRGRVAQRIQLAINDLLDQPG